MYIDMWKISGIRKVILKKEKNSFKIVKRESLAKLVKEKLTIYGNREYEDKNWDQRIASILFAYRSKIQKSSKMTPFYLTYGRRHRPKC
ncbi:hypothetical protein RhiirA4_457884 [Rhizophagus irregularis]|uniref:Uncharacterized protein n=1 Tax=Rhizophagus irregularis TaxID=588596 RepID=A0A2I1GB46_9GLOM|nr:hypothetical protein RhiirA4_457884 [Rhizophagus irregularis]